jgi:hypothetical protein
VKCLLLEAQLSIALVGYETNSALIGYEPYWSQVQVQVTLRLTVSQSVSLGVGPHLGLITRYLLLFSIYGLVFVGRPL